MAVSKEFFISENGFAASMKNTVEPCLKSISEDSFFEAKDGKKIHYVFYKAENARGNIVIAHGFTESAEKFLEMCWYFVKMNLNVFIVDHRGHGLSHRHNTDKEVVHIKYFDQYVDDLQTLVEKIVLKKAPGLPLYLYSHSMGGAISVQHLQKYPGVFTNAILTAPMIQAKTAGLPPAVARAVTGLFIRLGKEQEKVVGYGGFNPDRTYEQSHDTSKERFDYYHRKKIENEDIRTAAPSYRWVNEAVKVTARNLDAERNKKITAKVLLCQPEEDSTVYMEAEDEFIKLVKDGRLVKFRDCKHEIYNSIDSTVKEYLDTIENFLFNE